MRWVLYNALGVPAEVLHLANRPVPDPAPGENRVRTVLSPIHKLNDVFAVRSHITDGVDLIVVLAVRES